MKKKRLRRRRSWNWFNKSKKSKGVAFGFGPFASIVPTFLQHVQETKMIVATKVDGLAPPFPVHRMSPRAPILDSRRTRHLTPISIVERAVCASSELPAERRCLSTT